MTATACPDGVVFARCRQTTQHDCYLLTPVWTLPKISYLSIDVVFVPHDCNRCANEIAHQNLYGGPGPGWACLTSLTSSQVSKFVIPLALRGCCCVSCDCSIIKGGDLQETVAGPALEQSLDWTELKCALALEPRRASRVAGVDLGPSLPKMENECSQKITPAV
jgi:hypothetical protein